MTLADRIVVMRDGYLEQVGAPLEVFRKPGNTFVAGFIGSPPMNLVPTRVSAGLTMVFEGGLRLPLPDRAGMQIRPDMDVIMGLRTEDITVVNGHEQFPSEWKAEGASWKWWSRLAAKPICTWIYPAPNWSHAVRLVAP